MDFHPALQFVTDRVEKRRGERIERHGSALIKGERTVEGLLVTGVIPVVDFRLVVGKGLLVLDNICCCSRRAFVRQRDGRSAGASCARRIPAFR